MVIDEVAGQLIALIAIPLQAETWWTIVLAFLLFRFFDIVKPYPARNFENSMAAWELWQTTLLPVSTLPSVWQ